MGKAIFTIKQDSLGKTFYETSLKGHELLCFPTLNKGTAFTREEREQLELEGLLPYAVESLQLQVDRAYQQFGKFQTALQKNVFINALHDSNEVRFYKLLLDHITEMLPIVYTPTEGLAIEEYSHEYRRPRGLYISYPDRDCINELIEERGGQDVDIVLVTDSEAILGIGDQGVGGIGISVAKLVVYTLAAGINPSRVLPVVLDVGTNNETLLNDPFYMGWRNPRVIGPDYDDMIDKFVRAINKTFPSILVHWEDFGRSNARRILGKYRNKICTFNDDIQGTGAIAAAGLIAASNSIETRLRDHKIVIFGSGTAGCGIGDQFVHWMIKDGLTEKEARQKIWPIDKQGLLLSDMDDLTDAQKVYARDPEEVASWSRDNKNIITLEEVVKQVQPTVLVGTSTKPGAFTEGIIRDMAKHVDRPIIFPLSNPTKLCEARPSDIVKWTDNKALIATGSPFPTCTYEDKMIRIGECNNAYIFPGIGLGTVVAKAKHISDDMFAVAVEAMAKHCPVYNDSYAPLMPVLEEVRKISRTIALAVAKQAQKEGMAEPMSEEDLEKAISEAMWEPKYIPIKPFP
ncbi:MAG TPA: NAD-dependent malic enzyme [Candidatus Avalokitesvara rifleensis]|uniref:NAD-dependent malic enzyme n=1 Tax=Candidatus Avalokitesvara rifleensis TaxID=3367620 RepID=UPI0027122F1B|nr:NAD-dependent malic enzyme [Candidatus Brocadiales bacterium]